MKKAALPPPVSLRIHPEMLKRIDALTGLLDKMAAEGILVGHAQAHRSDVLRLALARGVAALEKEAKSKRVKKT